MAEMLTGLLSKGTTLAYNSGESGSPSWTTLGGVKTIPSFGSDPEKVDVTDLMSEARSYIAGLPDSDTLEFVFVYKSKNFANVHALVAANKEYEFKVTFPDGATTTFKGKPVLKTSSIEVNGALEFSLSVVCSEKPTFTPAA